MQDEAIINKASLIVPEPIRAVLDGFEASQAIIDHDTVSTALNQARSKIEQPSPEENTGAWAEILAFYLAFGFSYQRRPWGTFYSPVGTAETNEVKMVHFPDISQATPEIITYWAARAESVSHPVLKARYADLVWDLSKLISGKKSDISMAKIAVNAYLDALLRKMPEDRHYRFEYARRALDIATQIHDTALIEKARAALLVLHSEDVASQNFRWIAYDHLHDNKHAGLTDEERQELIANLEDAVTLHSDINDPSKFNPHAVEDAARRLIKHYNRQQRPDDVKRLSNIMGQTFEHFASLGDALLASHVLQDSIDAYKKAGMDSEADRVRILMQQKIQESHKAMVPIGTEFTIPKDEVDQFLTAVVSPDDPGLTLMRIASEFFPRITMLEKQLEEMKKTAPFMAHISQSIMADDHVAGKVGATGEDYKGRLIRQAHQYFKLSTFWLGLSIERAVEVHNLSPEHFAGWIVRSQLFDDHFLLVDGLRSWFDGDHVKAIHLLIPQIELAARNMVARVGKPITKPHPKVPGVSVAKSMGDILYDESVIKGWGQLGPDLALYLLTLYSDPRGSNLRNEVAHGLLKPEAMQAGLTLWLVHTLLLLGAWKFPKEDSAKGE